MRISTIALRGAAITRVFGLLLLLLGAGQFASAQEGTKQVMPPVGGLLPNNGTGTGLLISKDILQGPYKSSAGALSGAAENRIYFYINDTTERFCFGFRAFNRPFDENITAIARKDVRFEIYDKNHILRSVGDNGTPADPNDDYFDPNVTTNRVTAIGAGVGTQGVGWIDNYQQAVSGPNFHGQIAGGYSPIVFHPHDTGNFYIVIYPFDDNANTEYENASDGASDAQIASGNTTSAPTILTYFDFTVLPKTTDDATDFRSGRVYCHKWSFIAYQPDVTAELIGGPAPSLAGTKINQGSELISSVGSFYALTDDNVIDKVIFKDGFRPLSYVLAFNNYGVSLSEFNNPIKGFDSSARSRNTGSGAPSLSNCFKVFLNRPNAALVGPFTVPALPVLGDSIYGCPGSYQIPYTITEGGDVSFGLDLDNDNAITPGTQDVVLNDYNKPPGRNYVFWDGRDGAGNQVSNSVALTVKITYSAIRGRTNIPLYDAELNTAGFEVVPISWNLLSNPAWQETDPTINTINYYWNDTLLTDFDPSDLCTSQPNTTAGKNVNTTETTAATSNKSKIPQSTGHPWNGNPSPVSGGTITPNQSCDDYGNVRTINTWFWGYENSGTTTITLYFKGCPTVIASVLNDIDDDDDGIPDKVENASNGIDTTTYVDAMGDADEDGLKNFYDPSPGSINVAYNWVDSNNDGISDKWDTDLDGVINQLDLDSDNDGIPDFIEAGGSDNNGDGRITDDGSRATGVLTPGVDADGDGLFDVYDAETFGTANSGTIFSTGIKLYAISVGGHSLFDFDGDGVPNYLDLDSDNDGIPDITEQQGTDITTYGAANRDGKVDWSNFVPATVTQNDLDRDGYYDALDSYDDRNGNPGFALPGVPLVVTYVGEANLITVLGTFTPGKYFYFANFNSGIPVQRGDLDRTGLMNMLDLDADGDGIPDLVESGYSGIENGTTGTTTGLAQTQGWASLARTAYQAALPLNTDGTGTYTDTYPNYLDIDADNDGITDNIEGQWTGSKYDQNRSRNGYKTPLGTDADFDGIDGQYDATPAVYGGRGIIPVNKDFDYQTISSDNLPDYIDLNSDDEGATDIVEGHGDGNSTGVLPAGGVSADLDLDGLDNVFDGFNALDTFTLYLNDYLGGNNLAVYPDFRQNVTATTIATLGYVTGGLFNGTNAALSFADNEASDLTVTTSAQTNLTERDWRYRSDLLYKVLPVSLISFKGTKTAAGNLLQWTSGTEANFSHFQVERSADGRIFNSIGQVSATGSGSSYRFTDAQPFIESFYRLKMVDDDGKFKYSPIILLRNGGSVVLNSVRPNPFTTKLMVTLSFTRAQDLTIFLSDGQGRIVRSEKRSGLKGVNDITVVNLGSLPAGIYLLRIITSETMIEEWLIK